MRNRRRADDGKCTFLVRRCRADDSKWGTRMRQCHDRDFTSAVATDRRDSVVYVAPSSQVWTRTLNLDPQATPTPGKLDELQIEPEVTSDKLMIGVASSDLPTDLVLFYLALLAANGVETWEAALRLDPASPCFEGVPSVLVMRLLSVIDRLQHDDVQALAREDVVRRICGIGQWAWSILPASVAGLFYAESIRSTDDAADKKD
ncbi:hypothetical protein JKP88DRAFT_245012 [Tribonema minus]|uniref:Uncharacterized protein n=1 Tax=Tribonema minus TaxID=303371 RepID=A0A836CG01_9STRA|nr:hypothetical protein JKP88DRAFT_245012 [Tribonema minus]